MKKKILIIFSLLVLCGIGAGSYAYLNMNEKPSISKISPKKINLVAVGDSLTYGVGDSTKKGGYVNLIKNKLDKNDNVDVSTSNFGISGETSTQINKRIEKQTELQTSLRDADIITVTVGGNDLMHILEKRGFGLTKSDIIKGTSNFEINLNSLINNIRKNNNQAPIYLISIYNPFGVYLKDIKYMDTAVKNWNDFSSQTAKENYNVHFVNIDKLLSEPAKTSKSNNGEIENPYLYKKDHFHPNDEGYNLITNELYRDMKKNEDSWLNNK